MPSGPPSSNHNEQMRNAYNCDFYQPGEFFGSPSMPVENPQLLDFKHRLEDIVNRRDNSMAAHIHKVLQEASPNDRLFFAVGYGKILFLDQLFITTVCFAVHLMSPAGIIGKLKQEYNYSATRLCTDSRELRFVFHELQDTPGLTCLSCRLSSTCGGPGWCDSDARQASQVGK